MNLSKCSNNIWTCSFSSPPSSTVTHIAFLTVTIQYTYSILLYGLNILVVQISEVSHCRFSTRDKNSKLKRSLVVKSF